MDKPLKVIWSRESSRKLEQVKTYLLEEWSEKEVNEFLGKLRKFEHRISYFPLLYPASKQKPHLRKGVITKQQSVIYEVDNHLIRIVTILDNRQEQ